MTYEEMRKTREKREREGRCNRCGADKENKDTKVCDSCRKYLREYKERNSDRIKARRKSENKNPVIRQLKTYKPVIELPEKRKLYEFMLETGTKTIELAEALGVTQRTVERWLFHPVSMPNENNQEKINNYFDRKIFDV